MFSNLRSRCTTPICNTQEQSGHSDGFWMQTLDWRVRDPEYNPRLLCTMCLPFSFTFRSSNIVLRPREAGPHVKHAGNVLRVSSPTSFGECFVWANSSQKMGRICVALHTWEQSRALTCGSWWKEPQQTGGGANKEQIIKRDETQKTVATGSLNEYNKVAGFVSLITSSS